MAVACLSLAGVPATAGFLGKVYLTSPAARADLVGLSIVLWVNAAISAAYYLRIIATMFLRPEAPHLLAPSGSSPRLPQPPTVVVAVLVSVVVIVLVGVYPPVTRLLGDRVQRAAQIEGPTADLASEGATASAVTP
jgi:NADH-quinone oxidoreductase subunit N